MKHNKTILFVCAAMAILSSVGCEKKYRDMDEVRKIIRAYNDALAKCHYELTLDPLESVATAEEMHRNEVFIEKLKFEKTRMKADIKEFKFEAIDISGKELWTARTNETWVVSRINLDTGEVVQQPEEMNYRLDYILKLEGGKWLVDKVHVVEPPK